MSTVLHPGPPPLTIEAADAAIDYIDFMAAVVRGVDLIDVTKKGRKEWRSYLAQHYPNLIPADRFWFANAAGQWTILQASWPYYPPETQEMLRQQWSVGLDAVLNFVDPVIDTGRGGSQGHGYGYGAAQPAYYAAANSYAANNANATASYPQRGAGAYDDLLATILASQDRQEREAGQRSPEEQLQVRAQNNAINAQMLSNISSMGYKASMAIASNIKW